MINHRRDIGIDEDEDDKNPYAISCTTSEEEVHSNLCGLLSSANTVQCAEIGCAIGGTIGGCLIPVAFMVLCIVVFNDFGGLFFWPLFIVFAGLTGAIIGSLAGCVLKLLNKKTTRKQSQVVQETMDD